MESQGEVRSDVEAGRGLGPPGDEVQRLRRALERSEARFRGVIERNADAIVVVDRLGVVRFANHMAERLFGATREALIGTSFGFPLVADETTELDLCSTGSPRVAEMRVVESEWEGQTAYIASLRDVTERKRAEQSERGLIREHAARTAAEEAARRLRFLLESSTVLSSSLDYAATLSVLATRCVDEIADWVVIFCVDDAGVVNRLEVAHRDPARSELVRALRDARVDPEGTNPVLEVIRTGRPLLVDRVDDDVLDAITRNARERELIRQLGIASFMIVPMIARDHVLGAIALVAATPDRRLGEVELRLAGDLAFRAALAIDNARLYREAQRANQMKSDFLAVVSHDLRTPFNAIIGYADLLLLGIPAPIEERSREQVQRIRTAAKHLLYLMDELLSFARLDAGREKLRLDDVDARDLAREVAAVMEPLAHGRGLRLALDLPDGPVTMRTDPDKLRQLLINLVGNAVKYTARGEVRLSVRDLPDERVALEVRDTGVGIAAEHLERIFEPFWQVDPTQRSRGEGTGLGLSVVQRLARFLGGDVSVESAVGTGSTFLVDLPSRHGAPPASRAGNDP